MIASIQMIQRIYVAIIFALPVLFMILMVLHVFDKRRKSKAALNAPLIQDPAVVVGARVISKRYEIINVGNPKFRQAHFIYYIAFQTDVGQTVEYSVPTDLFAATMEGDTGTLVTAGNTFVDFGGGVPLDNRTAH